MANIKHFGNNEQESNRYEVSVVVDERLNFEVYYEPFKAAIDAGVGSLMCSYNKVNGTYACENDQLLNTHLRKYLGFDGFVMSDWGATHSMALAQGLDQEMDFVNWWYTLDKI